MKFFFLILFFSFGLLRAEEVKIIACDNGVEMVEYGLEMIKQAERSIEFAPCFFGGELLHQYLDAIEKQMQKHRSLTVYLLTGTAYLEKKDIQHLTALEKKYQRQLKVVKTTSIVDFSSELSAIDNHIKMLVVDEYYFAMGGTNYDWVLCSEGTEPVVREKKSIYIGEQLPSGARDQDVVGRSPLIAKELRQKFHRLFALWVSFDKTKRFNSKNPEDFEELSAYVEIDCSETPFIKRFEEAPTATTLDTSKMKLVIGGAWEQTNSITKEYCRLIDEAKEEILIGNLYFCPASSLYTALMNAANRGVKITVITNGVNQVSPPYNSLFCWANRINYLPILMGRGYFIWEKTKCKNDPMNAVQFYEYYVEDTLYHKKIMIVDKQTFVIGSYNLGKRSDLSDYEMVSVIDSVEVAKHALKIYQKDLDHSKKLTIDEIRDWYFDPLISYKAKVQNTLHPFI
ncbi:MAG: putative cardiolipin synthase YwiE [Chlamydiales bacterium]|nr:putative cardiolipin synthase YwiE [Chlamydiales bacterium]MCH9619972.1 putative cardiolipin synthase YwiE [Chlamydiales bacterium]MCH9622601.1 putative cardiolipin synthase YwiE [Chlamydiales bacterium]